MFVVHNGMRPGSTEPVGHALKALKRTCLICASTLCRGVTGCGTKELHTAHSSVQCIQRQTPWLQAAA